VLTLALVCFGTTNLLAQPIDFDALSFGDTLFGFDVNADGQNDVEFSTTDPLGFGIGGPNPDDQVFVAGTVLESSSILDPDVRVDFLNGAVNSIGLGYALLTGVADLGQGLQVDVFDSADVLIGSTFQAGQILSGTNNGGVSVFPEGSISVSFAGVAAYALLDATTTGGRFAIDDFEGDFFPTAIPEPSGGMFMMLAGLLLRRKVALVG